MGHKETESLIVDFSRACYLRGQYDLATTLREVAGDRLAIMLPELHGILTKLTETAPPQLPHSIAPRACSGPYDPKADPDAPEYAGPPIATKKRQWRVVATFGETQKTNVAGAELLHYPPGTQAPTAFFVTAPTLEAARAEAMLQHPNATALDIKEEG